MRFLIDRSGSVADARTGDEWGADKLGAEALARAGVLAGFGAAAGRKVMIRHAGTPAFFADLFAVWHTGACAVCLNPAVTEGELLNLVDFVDPVAVLVDDVSDEGSLGTVPVIATSAHRNAVQSAGLGGGAHEDEALMLFTSGTTGTPKGVVHTFRSLQARIALNRAFIGADDLENTLCVLPTHFGHGLIGNCLTPLFAGKRLILASGGTVTVAARLGETIDRFGITFLSSVPSFWKLVLKMGNPPRHGSLRRTHVGSAPLSKSHWESIVSWAGIDRVLNMYGITETANWIGGASASDGGAADGRIGTVWGGHAAVLTARGELCCTGQGELLVQTPSLMKGYYKRVDLTQAVLRDGWFHTGDIGRIEADGTLYLVGRRKYEINKGGHKVHPEDIDILLERHADVLEACAFAVPDDLAGETVGVAISLKDGASVNAEELRAWCTRHLIREKVPDHWFIVDEIPKTGRGKFNRDEVARHCLSSKMGATA